MSQLTMMYLRNFLVVAQLTILFGIVMSAVATAEARHWRIVYIFFATFVANHFLTVGHMSDSDVYKTQRNWLLLASDAQSGAVLLASDAQRGPGANPKG